MTSAISFRDVTKAYGQQLALSHVDLEIPAGTIVGLLGGNGSGKTTLIKCALGLLRPQGGTCTLLGEDAWNLSDRAKARLGYVPQVINFFPWMSVVDVIRYTGAFYATWNWDLVNRLRHEFDLPDNQRVSSLSVGQAQKLAILTAIGHEPDLLILDEPAASLDPVARRNFLKLIVDLAAPGKRSILFSTHILSDVERIAEQVVILKKGRVLHTGSLEDLKEQTHLSLEDAFLEMHDAR